MIKRALIVFSLSLTLVLTGGIASAAEKATPQEVYDMIIKAVTILEELGDDGLKAFNDPKGEFVWKDSYVFVIDCAKMVIAAHPKQKRIGADLSNNLDKNPDPAKRKKHNLEMCQKSKSPKGAWVEYYWTKLKSKTASRKIGFVIRVPGTNYLVTSGIYNDTADVAKLNSQLN